MAIDAKYWKLGTVNFLNDLDGVGRRYHLYTDAYGWLIPSLPVRLAQDFAYVVPAQADMLLAWRGKNRPYQRISFADFYLDQERQTPLRERTELLDMLGEHVRYLGDFWLEQRTPRQPIRSQKVGRNEPCPCGSGKKWKKCCGAGTPPILH